MRLTAFAHSVEIDFDPNDHISRRILETEDFYERDLLNHCYDRAPKGLIVDAGAHIGNHTLFFAGVMGRQVAAFEPNHASFTRLVANVMASDVGHLVTCYPQALGMVAGTCEVDASDENSGAARVVFGTGQVGVVTLDSLGLHPAVIKVDVEDAALAVLKGAVVTIGACHPLLYVETGADEEAITGMLARLGYRDLGWFGATPTHVYEAA